VLGFALRSTQHPDPRTYFVIIDIDRVIREYGMSKRHLKASRLKYLDRQKALFDRTKPELIDRDLSIERVCLEELPLSEIDISHSHDPQSRIPGLLTGTLGNAFFEPLPEDELQQWE
jgi:hypothetical protein